jgi:hypothetical protein
MGRSSLTVLTLVAAALVLGASVVAAQTQGGAATTDAVVIVDALLDARNRRDIDAAADLFADNATITNRAQAFTGKDEIKRFLQTSSTRGRNVVITNRTVRGDRVTWTERFAGASTGTDLRVEAVIQEGRIRSMLYQPLAVGGRGEQNAVVGEQLPLLLAPGLVLVLVAGVAAFLSGRGVPRPMPAGRPTGALVAELREWNASRRAASLER